MLPSDLLAFLTSNDVAQCLISATDAEGKLPVALAEIRQVNDELATAQTTIETLKERLKRAMQRETEAADAFKAREGELTEKVAALETDLATEKKDRAEDHNALSEELKAARAKLAGMMEHPDVRRAEHARLKEQARALLARAAELEPEEKAPPTTEEKKS